VTWRGKSAFTKELKKRDVEQIVAARHVSKEAKGLVSTTSPQRLGSTLPIQVSPTLTILQIFTFLLIFAIAKNESTLVIFAVLEVLLNFSFVQDAPLIHTREPQWQGNARCARSIVRFSNCSKRGRRQA
jgi:hypothetical protein